MGGYLTYTEALQEIDDMASLYPDLISVRAPISNFTTFEGRNLHWVRISDNASMDENEPEVLYTAVHHAREAITIQQMVYFMWYILENYDSSDEIKTIIDNTELYFVPFVNPDGFVYNETTNPNGGGLWRKNRRNHGFWIERQPTVIVFHASCYKNDRFCAMVIGCCFSRPQK